jgi:hypothetical protein
MSLILKMLGDVAQLDLSGLTPIKLNENVKILKEFKGQEKVVSRLFSVADDFDNIAIRWESSDKPAHTTMLTQSGLLPNPVRRSPL